MVHTRVIARGNNRYIKLPEIFVDALGVQAGEYVTIFMSHSAGRLDDSDHPTLVIEKIPDPATVAQILSRIPK